MCPYPHNMRCLNFLESNGISVQGSRTTFTDKRKLLRRNNCIRCSHWSSNTAQLLMQEITLAKQVIRAPAGAGKTLLIFLKITELVNLSKIHNSIMLLAQLCSTWTQATIFEESVRNTVIWIPTKPKWIVPSQWKIRQCKDAASIPKVGIWRCHKR